jgi:hypothetical protein
MKTYTKIVSSAILVIACFLNLNSMAQPAQFVSHGLSGGGAQYAPSINPANPAEIYVACDMSPMFHSLDTGNSWNVVGYNYINAFHSTHVEFTNNNLIRYCMNTDPNSGNYIPVKSNDGGATWTTLPGDPTVGNGAWYTIANPQNANQVIVSDYDNLYFSNNGGITFGSAFYTDATGAGAYVAGTFWDGQNIYICTNIGLMVSTNGGVSWGAPALQGIPTTYGIESFAGAKAGTVTRFFCITVTEADLYVGITGDNDGYYTGIYSMDYGTSNWIPKVNGISAGDYPFYVGMSNSDINTAYVAGGNGNSSYPIVLKTTDSGATWTHVFNTANNQNIKTGYSGIGGDFQWSWGEYAFGFSVCPTDNNIAVMTDEGFTHKTTDGGTTWDAAYVPETDLNPLNSTTPAHKYYHGNGIEVTSGWDLMWYNSQYMFEGTSDIHAIRTKDGGATWGFDYSGLNNYNCVYKFVRNPANGAIYAATSSVHDMYESTRLKDANLDGGTGEVMISTDSGSTFVPMYNFGHPVVWLALDPTNPDRMYASVVNHNGGAGGIWVSNNINLGTSATWAHLPSPSRTEGHPFNIRVLNDGTIVTSYSGRINASNIWSDSSGVFISTDGGNTWLDRSDPGMVYWTMDVVIDPWDTAQNTWYAGVFSGWGSTANLNDGGLYRTTNRGLNWTRINNQTRAYSITFDPLHQGIAYMTSETQGLWYSSNVEATNPTFIQVAGYPFQHPNRVYYNPYNQNEVWVISYGNGIRMGDATSGINMLPSYSNDVILYPNPATGAVTINFNLNENSSINIKLSNLEGQTIYSKESNETAGIYSHTFTMDNYAKGIYFLSITTTKETIVRKVVLE